MTRADKVEFLRQNINKLSNKELANHIGCAIRHLYYLMHKHIIKRSDEFIKELLERAGKEGAKVTHSKTDFRGALNPSWKGGISKNNYRYKKIQVERYPDKIRARDKVHKAVKSGLLIKTACIVCGNLESFAHHDDYSRPLDVQWLCRVHHREKHNNKH